MDFPTRFFLAALSHVQKRQDEGLLPKDKPTEDLLLSCLGEMLDHFLPLPVIVEFEDENAEKLGLPQYAMDGDAGLDMKVCLPPEDHKDGIKVWPHERRKLATGLRMQLPPGIWAKITHRSSTENRHRLRVIEGTIDGKFRGALFSQVHNANEYPLEVRHGTRLAQMILARIVQRPLVKGNVSRDTERGEAGFGSTGT